jgi:hypothetical protein
MQIRSGSSYEKFKNIPENHNTDCNNAAWGTFYCKIYFGTNYLQQPKKQCSFGQAEIYQIFSH